MLAGGLRYFLTSSLGDALVLVRATVCGGVAAPVRGHGSSSRTGSPWQMRRRAEIDFFLVPCSAFDFLPQGSACR